MTREELISLVEKIVKVEGTEEEIDRMLDDLQANVPYPGVSDLIYWNEDDLTPVQIVEKALSYKPIQL